MVELTQEEKLELVSMLEGEKEFITSGIKYREKAMYEYVLAIKNMKCRIDAINKILNELGTECSGCEGCERT